MTGLIAVVGSLNLDTTLRVARLPGPGETVHAAPAIRAPGGKGANQAVAASLLGGRVRLVGAVGDDEAGRLLAAAATDAGVDVSAVSVVHGATGQATILVDDSAENVIIVDGGVNGTVDPRRVGEGVGEAVVVVTGNELSDAVLRAAAHAAATTGAILVHNPSPFRPLPPGLPAPGVLVVNEHEFALFGGDQDDARPPADLAGSAVVVTRGARGALVFVEAEVVAVPAPQVVAADTSGCGDAFLGALAERLAAGVALVDAVTAAVRAGAFAATRTGTQSSYPTAAALAAWSPPAAG